MPGSVFKDVPSFDKIIGHLQFAFTFQIFKQVNDFGIADHPRVGSLFVQKAIFGNTSDHTTHAVSLIDHDKVQIPFAKMEGGGHTGKSGPKNNYISHFL